MLSKLYDLVKVRRKLVMGKGAQIVATSSTGTETVVDMAELAALNNLSATELGYIDGVTAGTALASKAVVLDANKDATGIRNLSGTAAAQGVDFTLTGGTSSTAGNAGGAGKLVGGTPGATGVGGKAQVIGAAGGATSGAGGAAEVTGGAGTAGNGPGGSVVLTGGTPHGTGAAGCVITRSVRLRKQGAPAAKTTSATLTAAEIIGGLLTANQGAAGAASYQLPLAADVDTALPDAAADDSFEFSLINISTVAAEDATVTTNTGWTLVGTMVVESNEATAQKGPSGRFRARKTGAGAWTLYRIS